VKTGINKSEIITKIKDTIKPVYCKSNHFWFTENDNFEDLKRIFLKTINIFEKL